MTATAMKLADPAPIRLDIGCGVNKKDGFIGIDCLPLSGVDHVLNAGAERWPFEDGSVEEAHASHFLEHLTNLEGKWERVHFFNELYRVLKPGGKATIIIPSWKSARYYGDPTHKEPFSEWGFLYLNRDWRVVNAIHADGSVAKGMFTCHFDSTVGYNLHPMVQARNTEFQQFAVQHYLEAAQDLIATLVKK